MIQYYIKNFFFFNLKINLVQFKIIIYSLLFIINYFKRLIYLFFKLFNYMFFN